MQSILADRLYLLVQIRDGKVKTRHDIEVWLKQENREKVPGVFRPVVLAQIRAHVDFCIDELIREGFVSEKDGRFKVHPLIDKLAPVLNISLTELTAKPRSAIWVDPVFQNRDTQQSYRDVFVVMPFDESQTFVYEDHIRKVCRDLGLSVGRADDFFTAHAIIEDVWTAILSSRFIVADCTGRNPNVFYEIGIAHTLGKTVHLITQDIGDVPFDVKHWRCLIYKTTPRGMEEFEESLKRALLSELGTSEAEVSS